MGEENLSQKSVSNRSQPLDLHPDQTASKPQRLTFMSDISFDANGKSGEQSSSEVNPLYIGRVRGEKMVLLKHSIFELMLAEIQGSRREFFERYLVEAIKANNAIDVGDVLSVALREIAENGDVLNEGGATDFDALIKRIKQCHPNLFKHKSETLTGLFDGDEV